MTATTAHASGRLPLNDHHEDRLRPGMTSTTSATTAHDESDEDHRRQVTLLGACGDAVAAALQSAHALPGSTLSSSSATSLNRLSPGIPRTILEPKQHRHSDKLLIDTNAAPFEEKKEDHVLPMMMRDGRDGTVGELKNHNNMYATASPTPLEEGQEALWVEQPTTYQTVAPNSPDSTQSTGSSEASQQLRQKKRDKKKNKKKKNAGKDDVYVQPPPLVVPQQTVVLLLPPDHNPAAAAAVAAATATAAAPYTITSVHSGDRPSTRASATRLLETAMACDDPVTKQALVEQALQQALEARLRQLTTSNGTNSASPREAKQAKKQWTREYDEAFQALKTGRYEHVRDCLERLSPDDDVSTLGFDNTFDLPSPGGTTTHFHRHHCQWLPSSAGTSVYPDRATFANEVHRPEPFRHLPRGLLQNAEYLASSCHLAASSCFGLPCAAYSTKYL